LDVAQVQRQHESKARLLDAALRVIRYKGYSAATIEDICQTAGLTKGSFFHHFKSKEELALAAAGHFAAMADSLFAQAPYRALPDPLDRLLGYVDFRRAILKGSLPEFTCLLGMMVQEAFDTHPAIRQVCDRHISAHAAEVAKDIAEAKLRYALDAAWSAESLGFYTQAVIQGAFILAKAKGGPEVAEECLGHLRRYLEMLFKQSKPKEEMPMIHSQKITPCLWFDRNAEEAVTHYMSIFKNSRIVSLSRYGEAGPLPKGTALTVIFELEGQRFMALNGGPYFKFTEAISLSVSCDTQTELDDFWEKLSAGGEKGQCGWLKDKFGLSWQIVPAILGEMMQNKDAGKSNRVMAAVIRMNKLEIDALKQAYDGGVSEPATTG
jgi:TetR/AcrR family transcriptional regulator, transcriptional repressor for nem operon